MTSTARSAMRLASSWMVIASGIVTSRTSFSFGSLLFSCGAALHAAAERGLRALAHFVRGHGGDERQAAARPLGRGLCGAGRTLRRRGGTQGAAGAAAHHARAFVLLRLRAWDARRRRLSPRVAGVVVVVVAAAVSPSPKRFLATSSAFFLVSSSCLRRSSSSRLRASAASRSVFSMASRCCADLGFFLGDLALFGLAQAGIAERMGAAALLFLGQRAQHDAGRLRRGAARRGAAGGGAAGLAGWRARGGTARRRGGAARLRACRRAPAVRRFLTSTTTCLLRPWLKLWRTTPVSVRGLSDSVVFVPTLSVLPSGVLVSDIQFSNPVSSARGRSHLGPARRSESAQGAQNAPETCHLQARQAGLHVPHLTGPMPNPIGPS